MAFRVRARCLDNGGTTSRDRRRSPRQPARWPSRYSVVDPARALWHGGAFDMHPCVLRDVSLAGAGLELTGREIGIGDRVVLNLQLGARGPAAIQLTGEVRHATERDDGSVTAGIEFVDVGDLERALLVRLLRDMQTSARHAG
jgi:hypothetical protein